MLHNGQAERIRLNGIDCPEKGQAYGTRAKQAASGLVFGKEITLHTFGKDKYGRTIADVLLPAVGVAEAEPVKDEASSNSMCPFMCHHASKNLRDDKIPSQRSLVFGGKVIDPSAQEEKADGLTEDLIRTAAKHTLRSSGIRVLDRREIFTMSPSPWLYVQFSTKKNPSGSYAFSVEVSLYQTVRLKKRRLQSMFAVTCESETTVRTVETSKLRDLIEIVERKTKEFANDFLLAHPQ